MPRFPLMMGSSPPSSTEATHFGTPSTNITVLSPDGTSSTSKAGTVPRYNLRINTNVAAANRDNLQLPTAASAQLSPTAEEFTPRTATFNPRPLVTGLSPVRNLIAGSMPDVRSTQPTVHGPIGQASTFAIRNVFLQIPLESDMIVSWKTFSTDENVTRTFQITEKRVNQLHHFFPRYLSRFPSLSCIDNRHVEIGIVRLTFNDDRDAKQAFVCTVALTRPFAHVTQLTAKDIAIAVGEDPRKVSNYAGQLLISVLYEPTSTMPMLQEFYELLCVFGEVKALSSVKPLFSDAVSFRVEYHNVQSAEIALKNFPRANSRQLIRYDISRFEPDAADFIPSPTEPLQMDDNNNDGQPSLTGRTTVPPGDFARLENVMARVMRESPSSSRGASRTGHNVVDVGRIEAGLDVRTTIMLRNIPNKIDQETLKNFLDATSFGDYDFMYLRIDFANNCNVGYAFINFVDPLAIIPFARARAGRRWNIFNSDKVAEISYATIQGRDCLVQKFRNSSVMLEHPSYRPKLYLARPHILAGQEETFPDPDNYSKMRRSIDNAEHIGLFPPRPHLGRRVSAPANTRLQSMNIPPRSNSSTPATWPSSTTSSSTDFGLFAPREGQAHREEQRRRRSQFDRGTPGAEIELSSYSLTDAILDDNYMHMSRAAAAFDRLQL